MQILEPGLGYCSLRNGKFLKLIKVSINKSQNPLILKSLMNGINRSQRKIMEYKEERTNMFLK